MRIAFLFEPGPRPDDALHLIFNQWLNGLVESQNQVKVIARHQSRELFANLSDKIEWSEPARNWSWLELPKILTAALPFAPEVIHIVLGKTPRLWQLWPALVQLPGPATLLSLGDHVRWPEKWKTRGRWLGPKQSDALAVPGLLNLVDTRGTSPLEVFVPGPLNLHLNWRDTLVRLEKVIPARPDCHFTLGWQWTDLPLPDRLEVRKRWMEKVTSTQVEHLETTGRLPEVLGRSHVIVLGPIKQGWTRTLIEQTLLQNGIASLDHGQEWDRELLKWQQPTIMPGQALPLDNAINQLIRTYHQLVREPAPWHSK